MSDLSSQKIYKSYDGMLQVPGGTTAAPQSLQDGNGAPLPLQVGWNGVGSTKGFINTTWTTAARPVALYPGLTGFNSDFNVLETWDGTTWVFGGGGNGTITVNDFSGTGSQTVYTLSTTPSGVNSCQVFINGIYQEKSTYTVVGTTLTFSTPPPLGTNNIEVVMNLPAPGDAEFIAYNPPFTGAITESVEAKLSQYVSVLDFGAVADGVTDNYDAIMAAINSVTYGTGYYKSGPAIYFPSGVYYCSQTINLKKSVKLYGDGSGLPTEATATIQWPAGVTGIIVNRYNTYGNGKQTTPTTAADGSIIQGLRLIGAKGTADDAGGHGIWLRARAVIEKCYIGLFQGNGINIVASAGGSASTEGNANNFYVNCGRIAGCAGNGIFVDGADVNAGTVTAIDCSSNSGWGFYDSSFLGNTYSGCHTAANTTGSYKSDNLNARNLFLNCYAESGQPSPSIVWPAVCLFGAGVSSDNGFACDINGIYSYGQFSTPSIYLNKNQSVTSGVQVTFPDTDTGTIYSWTQARAIGRIGWKYANLGFPSFINFYDRAATTANGYARDLSASNGALGLSTYYFGEYNQMKYRGLASAHPTTGTWLQGDIVWNSLPAASGTIGWVCVTGGTPGTWKTFGAISA